jgi:hypothetical protein
MMKSFGLGLALLMLVVSPLAAPASAGGGSTAVCHGTWEVTFSPGLSTAANSNIAMTTHGETGTINCTGSVRGHRVTGPGTIGKEGVLRTPGACTGVHGSGTMSMTIPTDGGAQKLSFPINVDGVPGFVAHTSDALLGPLSGVVRPIVGNCVTEPLTRFAVLGEGVVKS